MNELDRKLFKKKYNILCKFSFLIKMLITPDQGSVCWHCKRFECEATSKGRGCERSQQRRECCLQKWRIGVCSEICYIFEEFQRSNVRTNLRFLIKRFVASFEFGPFFELQCMRAIYRPWLSCMGRALSHQNTRARKFG